MGDAGRFLISPLGWLLLGRCLPGLGAIAATAQGLVPLAGFLLLVAAGADLAVDSLAQRRVWLRGPSEVQIEGFVDFLCFVWAPVAFVCSSGRPSWLWLPGAVFVLAGMFRLARFNVEGMVCGGYRGLPVTYSAVILPLAQIALAPVGRGIAAVVLGIVLVVTAALMASSRFVVARVSL